MTLLAQIIPTMISQIHSANIASLRLSITRRPG
jgi:hypothetical protein